MRSVVLLLVLVVAGCAESPSGPVPPEEPLTPTPVATGSSTTPMEDERCMAQFATFPSRIPTQDGCRCPWQAGCGPPATNATFPFTANVTSVPTNGSVRVTVHNDGEHNLTYYRTASCPLEAWASDGRQLWTMCGSDAIQSIRIAPGATDDSFFWRAVECLEGESTGYTMRCTEERPLAPGTYRLRQVFCPARDCPRTMAGLEVEVI